MVPDFAQLERARRDGGAFRVTPGVTLRLSGADAFRYLNGQVTRDLKRLIDGACLPACILTPKGKLCALLSIRRAGDDLIVETDAEAGDSLVERLERYLVADDAVIKQEPWRERIHFFGKAAESVGKSPDHVSLSRIGVPGIDLPAYSSDPGIALLEPALVEVLRIERGIPKWGNELGPETLPPEAGLDRTCIDYDRGCYPGQEVISRLKSIGRVNRLLHGFRGDSLRQGMRILSVDGKELGILTSAAALPESPTCVALGYLPRDTQGPQLVSDPLTGEGTRLSITATFGT